MSTQPSTTHCSPVIPVRRSRLITGSATFTIDASSVMCLFPVKW
jgi:hypothetical protein